ncbi:MULTISPECIES: DUF317 domain-containing protein [unclassified Streptomyces]|uniref:DUF317 domain-containing protein n=1 Tax=unclassified Streptomyces TaxID=2593676 RepID=UPI000DABA643|nr:MULTISPECIES: DUF317 domain-containing protein [unclassified Streptomyces]PZT74131.1 hypothetical protein DNK55_18405 [Streptomyces sp. AC1-42T]PZT82880.1 hypothetical protein DNK56_13040 [Streptomyces sp. AC1-42W]
MPSQPLDGDVHVTPLYLTGSTTIGDPAMQPLLDHGFMAQSDELANAYVSSPDQHVRLGFLPEGTDNTLWKVAAHSDPFGPPDWLATFDSNTPTELVTVFTSSLATSYAKDPDAALTGPRRPAEEGFRPLEEAGWKRGSWQLTTLFTAPDELAGLTYRGGVLDRHAELRGDQDRWLLWGGRDGFSSRWYATFTSGVPVDLVAATTARFGRPRRRAPLQDRGPQAKPRRRPNTSGATSGPDATGRPACRRPSRSHSRRSPRGRRVGGVRTHGTPQCRPASPRHPSSAGRGSTLMNGEPSTTADTDGQARPNAAPKTPADQ